jgi:hypothetical protein
MDRSKKNLPVPHCPVSEGLNYEEVFYTELFKSLILLNTEHIPYVHTINL